MGACCSTEGEYGSFRGGHHVAMSCVHERDDVYNHVMKGDFGASVMLQGFSDFISMATKQGKKGVNQDAMTVWQKFTGDKDIFFCGIFDGHGPCGHDVSQRIRDRLPSKLSAVHKSLQMENMDYLDNEELNLANDDENGPSDPNDLEAHKIYKTWKSSFLKSFIEVDKELSLDSSIDSFCSGTTAVTVLKQGHHLIIGNLGDSRAVMCTKGERGEVIPVQLTVDLKPSVGHEADRVKRSKGRVFSLPEEPGVSRIWLPDEDSPGLAMTRAFGDFCLKDYGLISNPQIFYRKLTHQDDFLVLATDGVWDVLTNFEVVKIVSAARARSMAAKFLVAHAIRAWKSRFPTSRTDDMAVVVLYFKPRPPSPVKPCMSEISQFSTGDSLSHLNSSISQYTRRSLGSDVEDGYDFRSSFKSKSTKSTEDWDDAGESLVGTSLNFPPYCRNKRSSIFKNDDLEI